MMPSAFLSSPLGNKFAEVKLFDVRLVLLAPEKRFCELKSLRFLRGKTVEVFHFCKISLFYFRTLVALVLEKLIPLYIFLIGQKTLLYRHSFSCVIITILYHIIIHYFFAIYCTILNIHTRCFGSIPELLKV